MLIENISRYFTFEESNLSEAEFLAALCDETDCGLLLDINNAYVNHCNLGLDIAAFIAALPHGRIGEVHLAGHSEIDGLLVDTHSRPVCDEVWSWYRRFTEHHAHIPCLIEWDNDLPHWSVLLEQQRRAQAIIDNAHEQYYACL